MSLRARILLLFVGFSVLPVLFLGAGDYMQSLGALRAVLQARGEAVAEQSAREVDLAHVRARDELIAAARTSTLGPFARVEVVPIDGLVEGSNGCTGSRTVPVRASIPPGSDDLGGRAVQGLLPVETLLEWAPALRTRLGEGGSTQLLERVGGRVLFDSRCAEPASGDVHNGSVRAEGVAAAVAEVGAGQPFHRSLRYEADSEEMFAAVSSAGPAWAVAVHTSVDEFVAPFRGARILYLGLVLLVIFLAGGLFMLLARGAFRSLSHVISAADQIELGNLRPWLPPPGEDEVGRLSLAFRRMTERLDASIRQAEVSQKLAAVGELATYLSHEIRNPLSSIRLSLQSLHRDLAAGFIPHDSARVIEIALGEVKRLDGVVCAVLEMGRPAGPADDQTCRAHHTLEETLDVLRPKVRAQGIEMVFVPRAGRDLVRGDSNGLRSVIINLVVNAIDALEGRPDARIRISTWSGDGDELHVRVADNGPGVPPELAESIFEPFFTTKTRGNGIGLPTALRTVQPWGGSLVHEPVAAGSGAVFVVKLKLAEPPVAETAPEKNLTTAQS